MARNRKVGARSTPEPGRHNLRRLASFAGPADVFAAAVDLLGPYPWPEPPLPLPPYVIGARAFEQLSGQVLETDVARCVRVIGERYAAERENVAGSVRTGVVAKRFAKIEALAQNLADSLEALDEDERFLLTFIFDFEPADLRTLAGPAPSERVRLFEQVVLKLPSNIGPLVDGRMAPGELVLLLRDVVRYVSARRQRLADELVDPGGKGNLRSRRVGSPRWDLVHCAWKLMARAPHLHPSGTEDGPLHRLVGYIHEWVTGEQVEASEFVGPIKKYVRLRRELDPLRERFHQLATEGIGYSEEDFGAAMRRPDLRPQLSVPPHVLDEAEALRAQIAPLESMLNHG